MATKAEIEIFNDLKQYSKKLHYIKYRNYDYNNFESEIMFWGAKKLDRLYVMKLAGEKSYRGYLKTSIERLIFKSISKERLNRIVNVELHDEFVDTNSFSLRTILTPYIVDILLRKKDESIFVIAKETCTEKQYEAIEMVYKYDIDRKDVAISLGVTSVAIYDRIDKGITAMILKSQS